jgi:hypothetical protein
VLGLVLRALPSLFVHEDADVLADHLVTAVAEQYFEIFIDVENFPVHVVVANRLCLAERLDLGAVVSCLPLVKLACFFSPHAVHSNSPYGSPRFGGAVMI